MSLVIFTLVSNMSAAIFVMTTIAVKRDRVTVGWRLIKYGSVAGLLNFLSFFMYLKSLEEGVASLIVPFLSLSTFLALSFSEIVPTTADKARNTSRALLVLTLVVIWISGIGYFMNAEGPL